MGYVLEFRDESHLENVIEKMHRAKRAVHEACEAIEEAESGSMNERNRYRSGMYRDDMGYRRSGHHRDDMDYRGGRYDY